jgi:membrane protein DedA with SNARE-associated domain
MQLIPPVSDMMELVTDAFEEHGVVAVGICVVLENLVVFNLYFPGSLVILAGMASTAWQPSRAALFFGVITIFSQLTQSLNFGVGKYSKSKGGSAAVDVGWWEFGLAFMHPQTASLASFRSGNSDTKFQSFILKLFVCSGAWHSFWAITMYNFGTFGKKESNFFLILFFLYLVLWAGLDIRRFIAKQAADESN